MASENPSFPVGYAHGMAEWTGLEPATPGVTGRYSNQLNYHSEKNPASIRSWWVLRGSNPRPSPCKGDALPTELSTRKEPEVYGIFRVPAKEQLPAATFVRVYSKCPKPLSTTWMGGVTTLVHSRKPWSFGSM